MSHFTFRRPVVQDAEALGETAAQGTAAYAAFAPTGWKPPHEAPTAEQLADPARWWLLGEAAGRPAGHITFMPATAHVHADPDPELAHLSGLFVLPEFHGGGLASALLRLARAEARARGGPRARLRRRPALLRRRLPARPPLLRTRGLARRGRALPRAEVRRARARRVPPRLLGQLGAAR